MACASWSLARARPAPPAASPRAPALARAPRGTRAVSAGAIGARDVSIAPRMAIHRRRAIRPPPSPFAPPPRRVVAPTCRSFPPRPRAAAAAASDVPTVPPSNETGAYASSVACVMLAVFLHLLGFTVTGPITPGLVAHFALHPSEVGYLTSAYPLGMFFALFAWPRLSDRVGRKPVIVASLLGVGGGLIAQAACVARDGSLMQFLGLRVLAGAFAGASPVVKAYLADVATKEQLPSFMAWREAACTLAFIVGPTLGGALFSGSSLASCVAVTGWASVAAAALVLIVVREEPFSSGGEPSLSSSSSGGGEKKEEEDDALDLVSNLDESASPSSSSVTTSPPPSLRALEAARRRGVLESRAAPLCPLGTGLVAAVGTICVTSFLYNAGQSTFDSFFPVYCSKQLGLGPREIGAWLTMLAAVSFTVSAAGFARAQKIAGLTLTAAAGLAIVAAGLLALGVAGESRVFAFVAALTYVAGIPLFTPAVPILLMQCVPANKRGAVMGLDSAVNAVARIVAPVAFGKWLFAGTGGGGGGVSGASGAAAAAAGGGNGAAGGFLAAGVTVALAATLVVVRRFMVMGAHGWRGDRSAR